MIDKHICSERYNIEKFGCKGNNNYLTNALNESYEYLEGVTSHSGLNLFFFNSDGFLASYVEPGIFRRTKTIVIRGKTIEKINEEFSRLEKRALELKQEREK